MRFIAIGGVDALLGWDLDEVLEGDDCIAIVDPPDLATLDVKLEPLEGADRKAISDAFESEGGNDWRYFPVKGKSARQAYFADKEKLPPRIATPSDISAIEISAAEFQRMADLLAAAGAISDDELDAYASGRFAEWMSATMAALTFFLESFCKSNGISKVWTVGLAQFGITTHGRLLLDAVNKAHANTPARIARVSL